MRHTLRGVKDILSEEKNLLIKEVRSSVSESLNLKEEVSDDALKEIITSEVFKRSKQSYIEMDERRLIINSVYNSMRGLGILQPVIDDNTVTEIMVNGPNQIFIERKGKIEKLDLVFESREKLEDIIQSVVSRANRTVNESSPIVDARLPDGSRVNIVLQPVALNGPIMTIRKFPDKPVTIENLIEYGSITDEAAEALNKLVKARYNIFICGGTSSGKTTFLNVVSNFIPGDERIITIEDSAELRITGVQNIVKMETRNSNTEGRGEVTIRDLIKTSLRMRPERIIVGEVRGPEALDMLQAMNTGHDGSLSTGHANSSADMFSRLETMVLSAAHLPLEAIRQQIASAVNIIIHLSRMRDKSRKVMEISEIAGYSEGKIHLNPLFKFIEDEQDKVEEWDTSVVSGELKRTGNEMIHTLKFRMAGIRGKV